MFYRFSIKLVSLIVLVVLAVEPPLTAIVPIASQLSTHSSSSCTPNPMDSQALVQRLVYWFSPQRFFPQQSWVIAGVGTSDHIMFSASTKRGKRIGNGRAKGPHGPNSQGPLTGLTPDSPAHKENSKKVPAWNYAILVAGLVAFSWALFQHFLPFAERVLTLFLSKGPTRVFVDTWINWAGIMTASVGADAYQNQQVHDTLIRHQLLNQPSEAYVRTVFLESFYSKVTSNQWVGFLSSPVVLWLFKPFLRWPFEQWGVGLFTFSIATYATVSAFFTTLILRGPWQRIAGIVLLVWAVLMYDDNIRLSLQMGQIDALYLVPTALAAYFFGKKLQHRWGRWAFGASMALAIGIKIIPLAIPPQIVLAVVILSIVMYRKQADQNTRIMRDQLLEALLATAVFASLLIAITYILIPTPVLMSWLAKIDFVTKLPADIPQNNPDTGHYIRYLVAMLGYGNINWPIYYSWILMALPVWLSSMHVAKATVLRKPHLMWAAFGLMMSLFPFVSPQGADYYNLVMLLPTIFGLFSYFEYAQKPFSSFSVASPRKKSFWSWILGPLLVVVGHVFMNITHRQRLMRLIIPDWANNEGFKTAASEHQFNAHLPWPTYFSLDNIFGPLFGNLLLATGMFFIVKKLLDSHGGSALTNPFAFRSA